MAFRVVDRTQKQTEGAITVNRGGGKEKKEREDRKRLGWDGMGWGEELELTLNLTKNKERTCKNFRENQIIKDQNFRFFIKISI
jgi:hypothetical protein